MNGFRLISYCISHMWMMIFLMAFSRRRYSVKTTAGILTAAFLLLSGLEVLHFLPGSNPRAYALIVVVQILIVQGTAIVISEFRDFRALFTGLTASNYTLPGTVGGVYLHIMSDWTLVAYAYEILMNAGILWILVKVLRSTYLEIQAQNRGEWSAMCLMPSLFYVSATGVEMVAHGSGRPLEAMMAMMFFLITMQLSYYLVFLMIGKLYREERAVKDREIMRAGIRALRHKLEELGETERKIAVHLHDRRHLVRIMQEMMAEKNYDGMNQMLEQMQDMTEVRCPAHYTDNAPVNGVLVYYASEAEKKGIPFFVHMELPESLRVNDWQLAVVIGNLLDNAVLACEEMGGETGARLERNIRVTGRQARGQVLVEVCNTCGGEVVFDSDTGLPVTSRGENHGIGLQSVAHFVERNQAAFDCGVEQGVFFARILI